MRMTGVGETRNEKRTCICMVRYKTSRAASSCEDGLQLHELSTASAMPLCPCTGTKFPRVRYSILPSQQNDLFAEIQSFFRAHNHELSRKHVDTSSAEFKVPFASTLATFRGRPSKPAVVVLYHTIFTNIHMEFSDTAHVNQCLSSAHRHRG